MEANKELSIGKYLKRIREEKQLTISDLAERSCIHAKFLRMIESDNFEGMGGIGYSKAMTISYARMLGANEKLVLQKFNSKISGMKPPSRQQKQKHRYKKVMIPTSAFYIVLLTILIIVLSFVVVNLHKSGQLNFSLRQYLKKDNNQKAEFLQNPVKKKVSLYDSLQEEKSKVKEEQNSSEQGVKIDLNALRDTMDYTDQYLFEGQDSPLNVKD